MSQQIESVLVGEPTPIEGTECVGQYLTNGHRISWVPDDPYSTSLGIPNGEGLCWASSEFDGWIDTTTYDEVGFFVKEDGVIRFAKTSFSSMEDGEIHARAMVEIWNRLSGKHYELVGQGIGWAACKRNRNETPPGVELKDVHRFYYLDENLNPIK